MKEEKLYNLQWFEIIRYFAKNIIGGKITLDNANENQSKSSTEIVEFNKYTKSRNQREKKAKKIYSWNLKYILWRLINTCLNVKYFH